MCVHKQIHVSMVLNSNVFLKELLLVSWSIFADFLGMLVFEGTTLQKAKSIAYHITASRLSEFRTYLTC